MPHAIDTLNVFRIEKNSPNNKNELIIPSEVKIKLFLISFLSVLRTDKSLIDKTGNTHGIKFNIRPPTKEISNKENNWLFKKEFFEVFLISIIFSYLKLIFLS